MSGRPPSQDRLQQYVTTGAHPEHLDAAEREWTTGANLLRQISKELGEMIIKMDGSDEDAFRGNTADAAKASFKATATSMDDKADEMDKGAAAFAQAAKGLRHAKTESDAIEGDGPGTFPKDPGVAPGSSQQADVDKQRKYDTAVADYWDKYNANDKRATKAITELEDNHDEQAKVFQKIHGETPPAGPTGGGGSSTGTPQNPGPVNPTWRPPSVPNPTPPPPIPTPPTPNPTPTPTLVPPHPTAPPVDPGAPQGPGPTVGTPQGPSTPVGPITPGTPGTPGVTGPTPIGGVGGAAAGGAAGGAAAAGLAGGLAGLGGLGGRPPIAGVGGLSSSGVRGIGASSRPAGSGSVLGRGGKAGAGAGGRAGGARAGAGAGAGRGSAKGSKAGSRGARGAAGSRAGAGAGRGGKGAGKGVAGKNGRTGAGAGAGRGTGKDKKGRGADQDFFDDGQDWIDDAEAQPGVID